MTVLKLGIDNGNYNTKSSERMLYASGFTRSDGEFITDDMQLYYDGVYYAVGGKRMSFQQDKTREDDTLGCFQIGQIKYGASLLSTAS